MDPFERARNGWVGARLRPVSDGAVGVPTLLTTIIEDLGGKVLPQLQAVFPDQQPINRTTMNAWEDSRVLILGTEGQVGQIATQAARLLGASRVLWTPSLLRKAARSYWTEAQDTVVSTVDESTLAERLRAALPEAADLILDMVWGPVIDPAIEVARPRARVVQVDNSGGALTTLSAPAFRNKISNFVFSAAERAAAYEQLTAHATSGALRVNVGPVPLVNSPSAWQRLKTGAATRKLVIVP